jgi:PKD repeat protein
VQQQPEYEEIEICVGVFSGGDVYGASQYSEDHSSLENLSFPYEWEVGNKKYRIYVEELFGGHLNNHDENDEPDDIPAIFDVIIIDGLAEVTQYAGVPFMESEDCEHIIENLQTFLSEGKGYIGHCGGAAFALDMLRQPRTWTERNIEYNSFLKKSDINKYKYVKLTQYHGLAGICDYFWLRKPWLPKNWFQPLFDLEERHPEYIGVGAYLREIKKPPNGVPLNFQIRDKDHPIFEGYQYDSFFCRWIGGPAFTVLNHNKVNALAYYLDKEDLSKNKDTRLDAWGWNPTNEFLFKVKEALFPINWEDPELFFTIYNSILEEIRNDPTWKPTNIIIEEGHDILGSQAALVTIDNYNEAEGKGRLVLFGGHPIDDVWDRENRFIVNKVFNEENTWYEKFYDWWDNANNKKLIDMEEEDYLESSNLEWFIRREVAWVSGLVPDDHMPPIEIEGRSSVLDLELYQQSEEFTINCVVGENKNRKDLWDTTNLSLYYKYYDATNQTLSNWIYYDSDYNQPWSFMFDINEANGSGEYYFCSILNTTNVDDFVECDDFPSVLDDCCFVKKSPAADFTNEPTSPYTNTNITFYDQSCPNQTIVSWSWDFGDGNTSTDQNATHQFTQDGSYTVVLNITDNESNYHLTTKNITVYNNPPSVSFNSNQFVIIGPNNDDSNSSMVSFESTSTDSDGNIVNWTWDFGDGTIGYGETVNHTYSYQGSYPITLRIADDDNTTCEKYVIDGVLVANAVINKSLAADDPGNHTWNTIQKGLDNLSIYNILYVLDDTYNENIIINKSIILLGENRDKVIINGSVTMKNPLDHELLDSGDNDFIVNMSGNGLLFHFNNDSTVGENYSSSNVVVDFSGHSNNGTLYGATWISSSIKGAGALIFNGVSDTVNISSIPALVGENVTISAWIYWTGGSGNCDPILSQSNTTKGYCLFVNNSNNKPTFKLGSTNVISSVNISNGWHHVVGSHNGTSNLLKIFVDGKNTGNASITGNGINNSAFVGFDNISNYFNGTIDEVAVWNRTLSDDEIYLMYNGNYGGSIACLTVQNAEIGIVPYNRSIIYNCTIVNNTVGVFLNDSFDITINTCNITGGIYGIQVFNTTPGIYHRISVVDSNIYGCNYGLIVNNSSRISIAGSFFNCTSKHMRFNESNFSSIYVLGCDSAGNVAPDNPDLSGINLGDPGVAYTYSSITNDSNNDQILYKFEWGDGNDSGWLNLYDSNILVNSSHTFQNQGGYYIRVKAKDVFNNETDWSEIILFKTETLPPLINSVSHTPETAGFGEDVIISVNTTDDQTGNYSGVKSVNVNITYPDTTTGNYTMELSGSAEMGMYTYTVLDPWDVGQYNYSIWVVDNAYNVNSSTGHSFNVSAQATIQVCTINDSYGSSEWVNLTDPPTTTDIGYELLDDGEILHIWNKYDSYYFNTSTGLQFSNHYDEYWSTNVLMLGYYNNDVWNLIYRTDELSGFNKDIESDDESFVNATIWKNLSYGGYDFRLAIRYHLGMDDNELTVIPYIKNIDNEDIPYSLGFAWELKDIQVDNTQENDFIEIDNYWYYLNNSDIDKSYTNLTYPGYYIRENKTGNTSESLYLRWDNSLNYKLQVKSRTGQYNAPVTLGIKIGTLGVGQEKYTSLFWHDASESTFYFDQYLVMGEEWATLPGNMVDGSISNYASTTVNSDVELCLNNTCTGTDLGTISKVEIRCYGYYTGFSPLDIILRPVFVGKDGNNHVFAASSTAGWSQWFDITSDNNGPLTWVWNDVKDLDCDVESDSNIGMGSLLCSKVEIRVTYTVNYAPNYSNPHPADGSSGISIAPLLNITVSDPNGDSMNITWLSNSSGTWQVFGTNSSVGNGTYHQIMSNASVNGQWWYWKVNVSDGNNTNISSVYKFYTGCQSKIVNTGSTNISGYLVMQVQVWNTTDEEWVLADDTIRDASPRTINSGDTLGLDTIFNGNVTTNYLLYYYGNGTYRVYVSFCDSDYNVLVCDDDSELIATYEFTVTFE